VIASVLAIAGGLAVLAAIACRDERGFVSTWQQMLSLRGIRAYELLRLRVVAMRNLSRSTTAVDAARRGENWVEVARLEELHRKWAHENEIERRLLARWQRLLSAIKIPGE
jgi:hypothetical protein